MTTTREPLTDRQAEILRYIADHTMPMSPTYREIQKAFRFKSPNAVYEVIDALERKGYVRRGTARHARNIEVLA